MKKIIWIALLIVVILGIGTQLFIGHLKPSYEGNKKLVGLSKDVKVYYDAYGIPHIYGKNEKDAFRALGYVHAQDRLWQMELLRRIGKGGLSEVFGKELLEVDKFFIALGIDENSAQTVSQINKHSEAVQLSLAYLDGINQFIKEGPTPIEFYLTDINKQEFILKDIYNIMGYMAFSFAMAHKTDPLLTNIRDKLGIEYLKDLDIKIDTSTLSIKTYNRKPIKNTISVNLSKALAKTAIPLFEGSNSWVLAPEKTKKGKVIFANDPHIGFSQPSVWYEAHVITPTYEKYGYHLAGVPFPILGHDRNLAYGMTMFENDDVDFYYEETHPTDTTRYKSQKGWEQYQIKSKVIKVKDGNAFNFTYKKTNHGPVLNGIANQIKGERPISMLWVYNEGNNKSLQGLYGISHAKDIETFKADLPNIHAPGLNIMYGDAKDNIAWWATARLYEIPDTVHTKFIYEPHRGLEYKKPLPFHKNPQAVNPPWNYVYSANNQPDAVLGMRYPGYYLPENRAKRIVNLLEPKNDWNKETVSSMMLDITSPVNLEILTNFIKSITHNTLDEKQQKILNLLRKWKGEYTEESIEATIYHRWEYYFLKNTFEDEMGDEMFKAFLSATFSKRLIAPLSKKKASIWWDNIRTGDSIEKKAAIIQKAFEDAITSLEKDFGNEIADWAWNKVHTLEHPHPIGKVAALRSFFNVGPFSVHGTREVLNNMNFLYDGDGFYTVSSGPSTRRVIDFSDIENSISILPTGQSGNPFSAHYKDQAKMFLKGEFRKMMMNREEIERKSKSLLTFSR